MLSSGVDCPQTGHELKLLTVSQSNSVQQPSQAVFQLSNNSIVQHSWPYSSPHNSLLMFPQLPPTTLWPYSPSPSSSCFSSPPFFHQPLSPAQYNPFILCRIAGNISVCAGCHNHYGKNVVEPDDMCIKHKEWREYTPQGSQVPQSRYGNVYYHFEPQCVWLRCSWFIPSQLEIPPDIHSQLGFSHKTKLSMLFNINLS